MQNSELPKVDLDKFTTENYKGTFLSYKQIFTRYFSYCQIQDLSILVLPPVRCRHASRRSRAKLSNYGGDFNGNGILFSSARRFS